jgi:hypothetical protein
MGCAFYRLDIFGPMDGPAHFSRKTKILILLELRSFRR